MAALTLTRHRRYRVGKYKLIVARISDASATTSNSVPAEKTRLSRIFGASSSAHVQSQAAQPGLRGHDNAVGAINSSAARNGDYGVAQINAATVDILLIGR